MEPTANSAAELTTDEMAMARRWVQTWQAAAPELERLRREELRQLDPQRAIALLCGPADYTVPPRARLPA
jgi:glycine/D-amino acid oxidase-like deaminating enzyme